MMLLVFLNRSFQIRLSTTKIVIVDIIHKNLNEKKQSSRKRKRSVLCHPEDQLAKPKSRKISSVQYAP